MGKNIKKSKKIKFDINSKNSKKIFQSIFNYLDSKYTLVDYGLDWLKLGFAKINKEFENLYIETLEKIEKDAGFLSSTLGNNLVDYSIFGDTYNISIYKSPVGLTFQFSKSFPNFLINNSVSLFSITIFQNNNFNLSENYILNIYGISFQLHKTNVYNIDDLLSYFPVGKTTRVDGNFNFHLGSSEKIEKEINKISNIMNDKKLVHRNFHLETIVYNLYEKSGKDKKTGKSKLRMTSRLGFRLYNKHKQLYDERITQYYPQYNGKYILRLEFVIGNKYLSGNYFKINYSLLEELFKITSSKVLGNIKLNPDLLEDVKKYTYEDLMKRSKSDIGSRLETYISRGGDISTIIVNGRFLKDIIQEF